MLSHDRCKPHKAVNETEQLGKGLKEKEEAKKIT
jgi:hypothetical protein